MSVNVRGAANTEKRRAIFDKHRINSDILILQETHSDPNCERVWENEWGGKVIFSHGTTSARGIAVFMSKNIFTEVRNIYKDIDGRVIIFDIQEGDYLVTIAAIYAPSIDSLNFFVELQEVLRQRSEHKIVVGDFNLALDVELDRENTYCNNNKAMAKVIDLMDEFSLRDTWRVQNGEKREFSWRKGKEWPIKASRIDFALCSGGLDQKVKLIMYTSSVKTDHRAIYLCIELDSFERGTGYWKFNNTLLRDKVFVQFMNKEIELSIQASKHKNPSDKWEIVKKRIKSAAIQFSRGKTREDKVVIGNLTEIVDEYESRMPLNKNEDEILQKTKMDLEEKTFERIQGVIFRSKARWYEQGEKNTKYFFALEKAKYNAKTCFSMIIPESEEEVVEPKSILEYQRNFYLSLYDVDEDVSFNMTNNFGIKVPDAIYKQQEQQISIENLHDAIKGMNNDKTPGEDGIPVDFYKVFWTKIKDIFYQMVLYTFEHQKLHSTARKGVLNLIPKAGKDTRYFKNLRPITLLNTDYKIIEKAIANKMLPALDHIIHQDQRGFMKGRRISVNIRKMLDIMQQTEVKDLEAVVLSLDFVKCFDKCSFSILHGSLEFFGFGPIIKMWTKILYDDFSVRIQNNGHFSMPIPIKKGVHQGGCCSSVYFLVIVEILALSLRDNKDIEGITLEDIKNILNQFADDMDVFSLNSKESITAILEELDRFKHQSGFTISYEKTTLYRIGSLRHSNAQMYDIDQVTWSNEDISVLGVTIAHQDILEKNYSSIVKKAENKLKSWVNRGLSLLGKVQVVNTLVASLFVYKMLVLPSIPQCISRNVDNIIRDFLWNGKKSKIAFSILQNPKDQGGLNLVSLTKKDKALKATWPQILLQESQYAKLVYAIMRLKALGSHIWRCSLSPSDVKKLKIKNQFWSDVLFAWCEFNYYYNRKEENQLVWYNSQIQIGGKPFFWKDIYDRGLLYVYQLYENGMLKSQQQMWEEFGISYMRRNCLDICNARRME